MDYKIDYEIFIPHRAVQTRSAALSADAMQVLENEAISLALGVAAHSRTMTRSGVVRTLTGRIGYYDSFLSANAPQANLKQRFQLGSNIWDTYTQADGYFSITAPIPAEASYIHMFQHPRWKITTESSTSPYSANWGTVQNMWRSTSEIYMQPSSSVPVYEINPAVDYFYNGYHDISTPYYESGIRIIAMNRSDVDANGYFYCSNNNQAYIKIFRNNVDINNCFMGTVLHELGHFCHYADKGYGNYSSTHNLLKESFASYVGWYLGERYYTNRGHKPSAEDDITGQAREICILSFLFEACLFTGGSKK